MKMRQDASGGCENTVNMTGNYATPLLDGTSKKLPPPTDPSLLTSTSISAELRIVAAVNFATASDIETVSGLQQTTVALHALDDLCKCSARARSRNGGTPLDVKTTCSRAQAVPAPVTLTTITLKHCSHNVDSSFDIHSAMKREC